ncbi:hypothetical protein HMSSN036_01540 [Paenibacillus macerans]|nr:hypothetical protein HMSSN036_01540 [Paenibacillus macerans]
MNKLKIAVLFGGCSEEHDVSIKSAQEIARNLDPEKFDPLYIGITKAGEWKLCDYPDANWESGNCLPAMLSPDRNVHGLIVLEQGEYKIIRLDIVFPVLHGKWERMAQCRDCWSFPAFPMQAAISRAQRCAWTSL